MKVRDILIIIVVIILIIGGFFIYKAKNSKNNNDFGENTVNNIEENEKSGREIPQSEFDRTVEKVSVKIDETSVSNTGVTLEIIDTNETQYGWGEPYRLQTKQGEKWEDIAPLHDISFTSIGYELDEDNTTKQEINWKEDYGELSRGIYRIVKPLYDNGYLEVYSNEFTID